MWAEFEQMMMAVLPPPFANKYIIALIVFIIFFVASKAFLFLVEKFILALTAKTKTKLDDMLVERTNKPISWLLIFIGLRISLDFLDLQNMVGDVLSKINNSFIYLWSGIVIIAVIVTLIDYWGMTYAKKTKSTIDDALVPLFRRTTKVVMMVVLAIMILSMWGVDVTGLLAGVGIAGIAIGFAVKDSLANIFGGVSIILDKSVNVGDKIELADGTVGIVDDVGIRATRIKTYDNESVLIPNGSMSTMKIKNYNLPDLRARVTVQFGTEYGTDPEKVKKLVLAEIKGMKEVLKDPEPVVRFSEMADFALVFKAFFWVDDISKVYPNKEEANLKIYKMLNKKKIGIPFPTQTVYVKKGK
ncbi:mechanosensitive ion channel family protein [Candidatus Woesearchaeota archaeon]|nr:mechanosensitive ion channel family protein [Candidatus Woesearchaeota archaeon]